MPTLLTLNNYHYRRGGADVAYLAQAELFEQHGWSVASMSMAHPENLDSRWAPYFAREIEYGRGYGRLRLLTNAAKSIYSWEAAAKVRKLVHAVRPDVAHAHNIYHHLSPSVLGVLRDEGVPVFLTLHDVKLLCPARTMYVDGKVCEECKGGRLRNVVVRKCMKGSLALSALIYAESSLHRVFRLYEKNVTRFVSPSLFVLNKFVEWGWHPDRFVHIPNFVDDDEFRPEFRPGRAFLYFGRLTAEKGVATLVRAAQQAGVPLWLVGTGPQQQELQALADQLQADVTFMGFRTGEELWNLVREARAVVLPSEWYENAPISLLEAYAHGKPVIGAKIGGIPEMIRESQTGILYESGSVDGLETALRAMSSAPDERVEALGRNAREWVCAEYSRAANFQRLLRLYGEHSPAVLRNHS